MCVCVCARVCVDGPLTPARTSRQVHTLSHAPLPFGLPVPPPHFARKAQGFSSCGGGGVCMCVCARARVCTVSLCACVRVRRESLG